MNDQLSPSVVVTAVNASGSAVSTGATTNDQTLTLTFTSSEATSNFISSDITATGGAISSFASSSSSVYTATFTPAADGLTSVNIAAGAFTDASSNNNTAAAEFSWTFNGTPASISSVALASDNATIAVTMNKAVYSTGGGSGALETTDFSMAIAGGSASLSSATPSSISASGNVYTLGIGVTGTPDGSEVITVNPVSGSIYDAYGNISTNSQSNNTATLNDQLAPTVTITAVSSGVMPYPVAQPLMMQVLFLL